MHCDLVVIGSGGRVEIACSRRLPSSQDWCFILQDEKLACTLLSQEHKFCRIQVETMRHTQQLGGDSGEREMESFLTLLTTCSGGSSCGSEGIVM